MITLIRNALIINECKKWESDILIKNGKISKISDNIDSGGIDNIIDAEGLWLFPGIIDDQVHFREPGLTHKGDIYSETRAAAAGGVTSFMEMPNTLPSTTNIDLLNEKIKIAAKNSLVNYSFFLGATDDNINEIVNINLQNVAGIKMFLGSSTGNLLIENPKVIEEILSKSPIIVAAHCEDDSVIKQNLEKYKSIYGDNIPMKFHPEIRSEEACYKSSAKAVEIAKKTNGHLHIFHLSTEKELGLLSSAPLKSKNITAEVCVHHLWFNNNDYDEYGASIKWNPAIKKETDRIALINALKDGKIDIVATDHAPHTRAEKENPYTSCPSGGPLVQHSLLAMLELSGKGYFEVENIPKWMSHNPAELYQIDLRGYIREGYFADLVLIDPNEKTLVSKDNIFYKCKWSPFEETEFNFKIKTTFVNGEIVFDNDNIINKHAAMPLKFNR